MKFCFLAAGVLLFSNSFAQYCTSGGPTSTVDSNVQSVQITGTSGSINHTGCPGVLGVQDLTNLSVTLNATNSFTLNVQFGTCNGNYAGSGEVWIDYDQSESFDSWESIGTWTGTPPVALSVFNFTVPANAHNGTTRMRVMQREGNVTPPLDPCGTYQWGSVMDFSVVITGGIDCSAYVGDDTDDPIIVTSIPYTHNGDNSYCYGNQNHVYASPDVYYLVVPSPNSYSIHATLCGSSFDTFLSVIDSAGNVIGYNDDASLCAPQSELTFSTMGYDSVYIIVEGWGTQMGTYTLQLSQDFVGVDEIQSGQVTLYPNPAHDYFTIKGNIDGDVLITDIMGKVVERINAYNGGQIATTSYAPGIYFVRFSIGGNPCSEKIIISE